MSDAESKTITATTAGTGMRTFYTVWGGQLISVLGSTMSAFAVQIWIYTETGSVTRLAMVGLAFALPGILVAPFAGALVDRWDRRRVMFATDSVAGAAALAMALLYATDGLALWHVYLVVALISVGNAFQQPAWLASLPMLVPKARLGRANGMVQLNEGAALVLAPALAGALLQTVGLGAVLLFDFATFLVAMTTLALVRIPRPERDPDTVAPSVRREAREGWRFVRERPGLFGLLWIYAGVNFSLAFTNILLVPLVLSFASEGAAGAVLSVAGFGMLAGSLVTSVWSGPKKKVRATMLTIGAAGLWLVVASLRPSLLLVSVCVFALMAGIPVANAASQVLWQTKVPPAMQGRVFSIRRMIAQGIAPIAMLLSGPLADNVFEPLMAEDGRLANTVGALIGTGTGRGVALMFILAGLMTMALGALGLLAPRVRHLEDELPDYVG